MDEKNGSEIILLRQAVARLSDRIEHLEQKLRKIERGWNPAARPAETNVQMNERESAPQAKIASLEIPVPPSPPPPPKNIQPQIPAPSFTTPAPRPLQPVPPPAPPQARVPPVEKPPAPPQSIPAFTSTPEIPAPGGGAEQPQPETAQKDKHRRDIELNIGKYWLNKIGIGVFVLGVGFLIAYSSKYFGQLGPWGKILTGYLVSAVLFFVGRKFEHDEKMVNFGYVLTGGAWALTYFTTFSMQHFPQSRVLESEGLDLVFLAAVGAGMLIHSLKYRSEALSGVAIFVGYATATIGDVRFFTLISCAIESIVILILVYKFKWLRMMFMGILMTYGAHFLWVMKNIHGAGDAAPVPDAKSFFVMNGTFLTLYWAVFTAGIHLLRKDGDETLESRLAVANIGNALFYFLLLYPDVTRFFPDQRFNFVMSLGTVFLLLGVCLFKSGKDKLFASDTMLGLALMTAAVPIKYMTLQTALIWIAELPFLCYAGIELKSRTIRFAAFLLFIWIMLHYAFYVAGSAGRVEIMGLGGIPMSGFTAFAAALSFGGVFTMLRLGFARGKISALENTFTQAFLPATAMFLSLGTVITSAPQNLTLYLFLDALLLFVWGYLADEAPVRIYSLLFLAWGILRFIGIDDYHALTAFRRWAYIAWEVMCGYSIAYLYRDLRNRNMLQKIESGLVTAVTAGSGILVLTAVLRYVPENWITFTFSGLSLLIFAVACLLDSRSLRASALAGSALVAWRFVLVDSFPSAGFADWLIIAFPPFSQAGIYLLYRKLRAEGKLPEAERAFPDLGYVLLQITLMALALRYISGWKMTAAFAVMNLALFGAGCLLREKLVRYASLAAMPVVMFRFLAIDDYPHGGRVWPLIFVLGSYYALVYAYVKAAATRILETDESQFSHLACAAAAFLSAVAIWKYAPEYWAAAIMALAGLAVFLYGYFWDSSDMRVSGCALLFTSLFRAVFWDDYSSLGAAMRWLPPTVELFSFAISYWFYRNLRLAQKLSPDEAAVSQSLCAGLSALACVSITRYCPPYWASSTLAVFTAAMFFAGLALGEMFVRVCSCLMFTIVAGRAMIFSEPYENLGRLRWLPIGAQLVSLLGVYLPYRGLAKRGPV
ncbi:MAG: DUF2339 domain-containing protein, partial [Elusimicrobia bacterium]|nr:DUF2339 domain-containing protein [Elusimicrobiota bacterium]